MLGRWLEPVVGAATLRMTRGIVAEADPRMSAILAAVASAVALAGMLVAVVRLKPAALRPAREPGPAETGIERVLAHKYYVDELYDRVIITPTVVLSRNVLWRGLDGLIDGLVNLVARASRWVGDAGSAMQTGETGTYAWVLVIGVVIVLGTVVLRA
jgi:NADH-quinone oxidoreductase subunit L